MDKMLRPILELTVIIPGLLLAYLPVRTYLRQPLHKLAVWLLPLLAGFCVSGGVLCYTLQITTLPVLFSAAGSYGCLPQDSSGHHLEIRQYFPGCVRGVRLRQQSVQGIQRHSHCKA